MRKLTKTSLANTIKCNLEEDTLSEWKIVMFDVPDENPDDKIKNLQEDKEKLTSKVAEIALLEAYLEVDTLNKENTKKSQDSSKVTNSQSISGRSYQSTGRTLCAWVFPCCRRTPPSYLGASKYRFLLHDRKYSAEGKVYQRLNFEVCVEREFTNMFITIILPSVLLALTSLSVFTLDVGVSGNIGNRLQVLFTIVLAIIANQFVSQGRLPYLAYFTWIDYCLLACQLFVYFNVVESAIVLQIAEDNSSWTPEFIDNAAFWFLLCLFVVCLTIGVVSAEYLRIGRSNAVRKFKKEGEESFDIEEKRLNSIFTKYTYKKNNIREPDQATTASVNFVTVPPT